MLTLRDNVDIENSIHHDFYEQTLQSQTSKVPFNEEAISVAQVVHRIIMTDKPKSRYYITKATTLLGTVKRILSTTLLDKILLKIG